MPSQVLGLQIALCSPFISKFLHLPVDATTSTFVEGLCQWSIRGKPERITAAVRPPRALAAEGSSVRRGGFTVSKPSVQCGCLCA